MEINQPKPDYFHRRSSTLENAGVALGGLFDIQPSGTDYDPDEAQLLKQHRLKKKKKKELDYKSWLLSAAEVKNTIIMAQSVSNDALWEKLSEMDKKFEGLATTFKSLAINREKAEDIQDFSAVKDEIVASIKGNIRILGLSNDSHFEANKKNIQMLNENNLRILKVATLIRKQQEESNESQKKDGEYIINFKFCKVRKTSHIITVLGLLVFILTLFCMKQQNDYSLLMNERHRQGIVIQESDRELRENN